MSGMSGLKTQSASLPRRPWRWPKGLVLFFGAWLLLLVGVRLWWGYAAQQRLSRTLAASRAAGFLLTPEDVAAVPAPTQADAAWWLEEAARRLPPPPTADQPDPSTILDYLEGGLSLSGEQVTCISRGAPALQVLRGARVSPSFRIVALSAARPDYRQLAKRVAIAVRVCGQEDHWAQAIAFAHDGLSIERCLHAYDDALIPRLIGIAIGSLVCNTIADCAAQLDVADPAVPLVGQPATRAQIGALIADMLDERSLHSGWYEAMRADALETRKQIEAARKGTLTPGYLPTLPRVATALSWWFEPVLLDDLVRMEGFYRQLAPDHGRGAFGAASPGLGELAAPGGLLTALSTGLGFSPRPWSPSHPLAIFSVAPSLQQTIFRAWLIENRGRAQRRMAACTLALRLYELDHGELPETLAQLVPQYLPQVPRDPFDPDEGPVRYLPRAEAPCLYALNEDMLDDGGNGLSYSPNSPDLVVYYRGAPKYDVRHRYPKAPLVIVQPPGISRRLPPASLTPEDARRPLLHGDTEIHEDEVEDAQRNERE